MDQPTIENFHQPKLGVPAQLGAGVEHVRKCIFICAQVPLGVLDVQFVDNDNNNVMCVSIAFAKLLHHKQ